MATLKIYIKREKVFLKRSLFVPLFLEQSDHALIFGERISVLTLFSGVEIIRISVSFALNNGTWRENTI